MPALLSPGDPPACGDDDQWSTIILRIIKVPRRKRNAVPGSIQERGYLLTPSTNTNN